MNYSTFTKIYQSTSFIHIHESVVKLLIVFDFALDLCKIRKATNFYIGDTVIMLFGPEKQF